MGNQQLGPKAVRRAPTDIEVALLEDLQRRAMSSVTDPQNKPIVTDLLKRFWNAVQGEKKEFIPKGKEWQGMGFQGEDPLTDFRAGGLLALENIVFFVEKYTDLATNMIERREMKLSDDGSFMQNYPWSAAGVNVTHTAMALFGLSAKGKTTTPTKDLSQKNKRFWELALYFSEVYCVAFKLMDDKYTEMKATYLSFNKVLEAAREELNDLLKHTGVQDIFKNEQQPLSLFLNERRRSGSFSSIEPQQRSRSNSPPRDDKYTKETKSNGENDKEPGDKPSKTMVKHLFAVHKRIVDGCELLRVAEEKLASGGNKLELNSISTNRSQGLSTTIKGEEGESLDAFFHDNETTTPKDDKQPEQKQQEAAANAQAAAAAMRSSSLLLHKAKSSMEVISESSSPPPMQEKEEEEEEKYHNGATTAATTSKAASTNDNNDENNHNNTYNNSYHGNKIEEEEEEGLDGDERKGSAVIDEGGGGGAEQESTPYKPIKNEDDDEEQMPCRVARVLFDFEPSVEGDLKLTEGDTVIILESDESGWWQGEGKSGEGRFPANYVEEFKRVWFSALAKYQSTTASELSLEEGDIIKLTEVDPSGWWKGIKPSNGASGWFPAAFVEGCPKTFKPATATTTTATTTNTTKGAALTLTVTDVEMKREKRTSLSTGPMNLSVEDEGRQNRAGTLAEFGCDNEEEEEDEER
mmetsp:Transcript_6291/g.9800  ORF Transcript_6291/g.9800 Transcript_6291/m.9800 type:complete len:693 (-) Transcript_6291:550-2628(-)